MHGVSHANGTKCAHLTHYRDCYVTTPLSLFSNLLRRNLVFNASMDGQGGHRRGQQGNYDDRRGQGRYEDHTSYDHRGYDYGRGNGGGYGYGRREGYGYNAPVEAGKNAAKQMFKQCPKNEGGCGGYHPGSVDTCWFKPNQPNTRIPEAIYRGYASGTTIPQPQMQPQGIQCVNPLVKPGDSLQFCIITQSAKQQMHQNGKSFTALNIARHSDNLLIIRNPDECTEVMAESEESPHLNMLAEVDKEIAKTKQELQIQARQAELMDLKQQLAKKPSNHDSHAASSSAAMPPNAQNGKHIKDNVASWARTKRKWTWSDNQVEALLGCTNLARMGQWYIFTTIYRAEDCTEQLMKCFHHANTCDVTKALKSEQLAIQDIKDMGDINLTGPMGLSLPNSSA